MSKKKKINLFIILLFVAIITIAIMTYFIYKLNIEKTEVTNKVASSNNQIASLENVVENLQEQLNIIANTTNETTNIISSNTTTIDKNNDVNKKNEKQVLEANGYKAILYSNNEISFAFDEENVKDLFGSIDINISNKTSKIVEVSDTVSKMYQGNNGTGVDPITFFIMENGTVSFILPYEQIADNNNSIPTTLKINGTINNLYDVVDMKTTQAGVIVAITRDGKEIKCWNEWMENL